MRSYLRAIGLGTFGLWIGIAVSLFHLRQDYSGRACYPEEFIQDRVVDALKAKIPFLKGIISKPVCVFDSASNEHRLISPLGAISVGRKGCDRNFKSDHFISWWHRTTCHFPASFNGISNNRNFIGHCHVDSRFMTDNDHEWTWKMSDIAKVYRYKFVERVQGRTIGNYIGPLRYFKAVGGIGIGDNHRIALLACQFCISSHNQNTDDFENQRRLLYSREFSPPVAESYPAQSQQQYHWLLIIKAYAITAGGVALIVFGYLGLFASGDELEMFYALLSLLFGFFVVFPYGLSLFLHL